MSVGPSARVALAVPAIAAAAWGATVAMRIGEADAAVYEAAREIDSWAAARADPALETVRWREDSLARALERDPSDASIHELLGVLALRRTDRPRYVEEALGHFRDALARRPTSPYTWGNVVEALYRSGDTGSAFEQALQRAIELGPREPEAQRTVANFGLAVWDDLSEPSRAAVRRAIAGGLERNPLETLQIAARRGRLALACRQLADVSRREEPRREDEPWRRLCLPGETS